MNKESLGNFGRKAAISASIVLPTLGVGIAGTDNENITTESRVFGITEPNFIDPHPELTHKIGGIPVAQDTDANPLEARIINPLINESVIPGSKATFSAKDEDDSVDKVSAAIDGNEITVENCEQSVKFIDTVAGVQPSTRFGDMKCEAELPKDLNPGAHELKFSATNPKGEVITITVSFTVSQ